jgi:cytochrome c551/c552
MPATESTWRDSQSLHRIFAVTGVVLTISTLWMFWKDHARSWKSYQVTINNIDLKMNKLRQQQFETGDAVLEHDQRAAELAAAKALPVNPAALAEFKTQATRLDKELDKWRKSGHPYSTVNADLAYIDRTAKRLDELTAKAQQARAEAVQAEKTAQATQAGVQAKPSEVADRESKNRQANQAAAAEARAAEVRGELVAYLQDIVIQARNREDKALGLRKYKSADVDAAKSNVDIAIRDAGKTTPEEASAELARREQIVRDLVGAEGDGEKRGKNTLTALNEVYQSISAVRKALDSAVKQITAQVDEAQKRYDDSLDDMKRLRTQYSDRQETYVDFAWGFIPVPGKKILTLPILDAFSSPRKIENLWSEGLTQSYNFSYVRRFDRCTTCHQSMTKTLPGSSTTPAYVRGESIDLLVIPPPKDAPPKPRLNDQGQPLPRDLEDWLGLRLADEGLLNRDDVTVALVLPKTPAATARIVSNMPSSEQATGLEIRKAVARLAAPPGESENLFPKLPGLMVGDVIEKINDEPLSTSGGDRTPKRIAARLTALAEEGKPIKLTVRRGLPNPYTSHPRLDLYVGDASPHRLQTFACTICHDGQGSGTDFNWVSHTPNTTFDMERWSKEHGWFDNPHWIYPMYAKRFAEAACLKCHHDVVELEPSEKYPEAPARKLTHGYHLIRKYGCYGCHEVNGLDGPNKRIGPDLRSEPNYFAVAQQIEAELAVAQRSAGAQAAGQDAVRERLSAWQSVLQPLTAQVTAHPEDNQTRNQLKARIEEQVAAAGDEDARLNKSLANLANMLKDVEVPGTLRRAGPSLRFLAKKADPVFLYDWIANPQHFRPTTRMPRFFGLWDHLQNPSGEMEDARAPQLEPIEIRGLITYFQSYANEQSFEPESRPSGIASWTDDERVARGKTQFQTRGCLACHNHKDFPEVEKYRNPEEIVQGPDLSGVGSKFAKDRNPQGPDWLYSWIKSPTKYHARTVMPNLFLDPQKDPGADVDSARDDKWFDPADDIVTYLLSSPQADWRPISAATQATQPLDGDGKEALRNLTLEHLNEAFYKDAAEQYYRTGIPPELESELKGAEKDLIVQGGQTLDDSQRLKYIGRKTIAKYGCFGCHDIPGFEDAKPIGTGLADWGRKDPARLAFEHITHYIEHGHGGHAPAAGQATAGKQHSKAAAGAMYVESKARSKAADPTAAEKSAGEHGAPAGAVHGEHDSEEFSSFYEHALEAGNRIGFIYQKLKEPRSYDFEKTANKRYNERLRMPQFPFNAEEREAVITFVLGLVADPPQPKYVFQAKGRNAALVAGKHVLEKYNCGGCHILELEKWKITYNPGEFGERAEPAMYEFLKPHFSPQELAVAAQPDRRNELHATLAGLPPTDKPDGLPLVVDTDGLQLDSESPYSQRELKFSIDLYQPAIIDGSSYLTGQSPVQVPSGRLDARYPTWGGTLTKYLLPEVTRLERQVNPNASGSEAYGWVPPPLIGEGRKVQTAWLHDFLLDPYPIRPAVFLRMPKFNMSSAEATALANYFAAADNSEFPYTYSSGRDRSRLAALEAEYVKRPAEGAGAAPPAPGAATSSGSAPEGMQRLDDAMKIVVNGNFCVKCHLVADFVPAGSERAKAPNLAEVYRRLRPEFVRKWIANPKLILPYTSMPVNIPYDNPPPILNQLYHGTNVEQIGALTDLLMNYDQYARQSTKIADRVVPAPAEAAPPTTGGGSN